MTAVLITGARAPVALDLARRFADRGAFVVMADSQRALSSSSRAVGASYRVPSARFSPGPFAAAVDGIAHRHAVDLIVPTCEEIFWLADASGGPGSAGRSVRPVPLFAPSLDTLRLLHDKAAFARMLDGLGIRHPTTEVVTSHIGWRRRSASRLRSGARGSRVVVKPAFSRFGTRTRVVEPGAALPPAPGITPEHPWLIQEHVVGEEFCVYAVAVAGVLTAFTAYRPTWRAGVGAAVAFERIPTTVPPGARDASRAVHSGPADQALQIASRLAAELHLTGQFGLDLIAGPDGATVLECNPRATSGIHLFTAGDDLPGAFLAALDDLPNPASRPAARPVRSASLRSARLALPHVLYAAAGVHGPRDAARFVAQLRAPDVLRPRSDPIPAGVLVRSLATQAGVARRARTSLLAASTWDIEWNGEPTSARGPEPARSSSWARDLAAEVAAAGSRALAPNVDVAMGTVTVGPHELPLTLSRPRPRGSEPQSYVVSPMTHFVHYAREELAELDSALARRLAGALIDLLGLALRAGRLDDTVIVGNALLSTNLLPDIDAGQVAALTARLVHEYPQRAVLWRSVHERGTGLADALRAGGYRLIPARSVLFTATRGDQWQRMRDTRHDRELLERGPYIARPASLDPTTGCSDPSTRERIAELYRMLYVQKYSRLNPQYTAEFVAAAQRSGLLEFTLLERQSDGRVDGVFGCTVANGYLAAPVLGYDTALPQELGLYRLLSWLVADRAHAAGVDLHNSSGVAGFKRNRGAESWFEYTAVHAAHLPWRRRAAWALLDLVVRRIGVPLVARNGL